MIHPLKQLEGYSLFASDGELGPIREMYFDAFHWVVRYLAVDVEGGSVLLSPTALSVLDPQSRKISVGMDLELLLNSPRFDLNQPFTRVRETELHNYFNWPFYWLAPGLVAYPLIDLESEMKSQGNPALQEDEDKQHLRSVSSVIGDRIAARDGDMGHIDDFLIDDQSWNILYLIADTGGLLSSQRVLISPQWVKVDWPANHVKIDLSRETIANSPAYDPSIPWDDDSDRRLREYYDRDR